MYRAIVDTETNGKEQLVYDVGIVIVDSNFKIIESYAALIDETYTKTRMRNAYYANKTTWYEKSAREKKSFLIIHNEITQLLKKYHVTQVWAHNMAFDKRALDNTINALSNGYVSNFFDEKVKLYCTQAAASATICKLKSYFSFCLKNSKLTKKGNLPTSAESIFCWIEKDASFIESHTALEDAVIESRILKECKKRRATLRDSIPTSNAWKRPQKKFQRYLSATG